MEAIFLLVFLGLAIVTIMSLISLAERAEWGWFVVGLFIPPAAIIGAMISSPTEESATHKRCARSAPPKTSAVMRRRARTAALISPPAAT